MRLFIHHPGDETVTVIEEVNSDKPLADVVVLAEGELLWVEGHDEPIEVTLTLVELGFEPDCHTVHGHRHVCREIHVTVTYNGKSKQRSVRPSETLQALLKWAVNSFGIDAAAAADLGFRLDGASEDLSFAEHIGSLTDGKACSVDLQLLPGDTNAG